MAPAANSWSQWDSGKIAPSQCAAFNPGAYGKPKIFSSSQSRERNSTTGGQTSAPLHHSKEIPTSDDKRQAVRSEQSRQVSPVKSIKPPTQLESHTGDDCAIIPQPCTTLESGPDGTQDISITVDEVALKIASSSVKVRSDSPRSQPKDDNPCFNAPVELKPDSHHTIDEQEPAPEAPTSVPLDLASILKNLEPFSEQSTSPLQAALRLPRPPHSHFGRAKLEMATKRFLLSLEPGSGSERGAQDEGEAERYARVRREARESIDRRLHEKRRDKHATANLSLLHAIRKPMSPVKEILIDNKVSAYRRLGESPANWSSDMVAELQNSEPAVEAGDVYYTEVPNRPCIDTRHKDNVRGASGMERDTFQQAETQKESGKKRDPRWTTTSETRAQKFEIDSNAWGSGEIANLQTDSEDSVQAVREGDWGRTTLEAHHDLFGWDGKLTAPPVDWEQRPRHTTRKVDPRFTDESEFIDCAFRHEFPNFPFATIPHKYLLNTDNHADGISMAPRNQTITTEDMYSYYGYSKDMDPEHLPALREISDKQYDHEALSKNFRVSIENEVGLAETSEVYSQRYIALLQKDKAGAKEILQSSKPIDDAIEAATPTLNIYLRPATLADLPQTAEIYNWHVRHGPRPSEVSPVELSDFQDRFDDAVQHKLPFIVAIEKTRARKSGRTKRCSNGGTMTNHPIQNINPNYQAVVEQEKVVGFACAQDWTAAEYCERITAEVEIYVAAEYRKLGIGRCLLDKMIQISDRGYFSKGGYEFHCVPEKSHLYSEGGGRDLHKIYICVRTWSKPANHLKANAGNNVTDQEDDYEVWMKDWFESWGFEQEGRLKQNGARNGR